MNKTTSFSIWYVRLAIMAVVLVHDFIHALNKIEELPYSQFKNLVVTGKVAEVKAALRLPHNSGKPQAKKEEYHARHYFNYPAHPFSRRRPSHLAA